MAKTAPVQEQPKVQPIADKPQVQVDQPIENDPPHEAANTDLEKVAGEVELSVNDMFARGINNGGMIKNLVFKQVLTKTLASMSHLRELLMKCDSEIYEMLIPVAGRVDKPEPAKVLDCTNLQTGEQIILVCNAMMVGAFSRAGGPIKGRCFALRAGDIKADKKYRIIDVVEVTID